RAAARELGLRRIERDVVVLLAIEERDVLGLGARLRVGERAVAARPHFRDEIALPWQQRPWLAAQIAEVDHERLLRLLAEDVLRAPLLARVGALRRQRRRGDDRLEVCRVEPDERRVERRLE